MFDRKRNLDGDHGDLLSYIYGEMDEQSRNIFESHLEECDDCAVDLGAFSDARLGVVEWRRSDFDHLATPEIVIPQAEDVVVLVASPAKSGFFTGLAELIGSVPVFAKAGAGLVAAALLIGVIYVSFSANSSEVAVADMNSKPEVRSQPDSAPVTLAPAPSSTVEIAKDDKFKSEDRPVPAVRRVAPQTKVIGQGQQIAVNGPKARRLNPLRTETAKSVAPRLNSFDDEEDQTLRLSDLFSQVGPIRQY